MTRPASFSLPNPRVVIDDHCARFRFVKGNPLDNAAFLPKFTRALEACDPCTPTTLLLYSGTLGASAFEPDIRNWMAPGRTALGSLVERLLDAARPCGVRIGFIPHFAHLLSDLPGQMRLWHEYSERGLATILSPASLITATMARDAQEHYARAFEVCAPRCDLCILEDLRLPKTPHAIPERVPWGEGDLPHARLIERLAIVLAPSTPVALTVNPASEIRILPGTG